MKPDFQDDYIAYHRRAWDREYERRAKLAEALAAPPAPSSRKTWRQAIVKYFQGLGRGLAFLMIAPLWLLYAAIYLAFVVFCLYIVVLILHGLWSAA